MPKVYLVRDMSHALKYSIQGGQKVMPYWKFITNFLPIVMRDCVFVLLPEYSIKMSLLLVRLLCEEAVAPNP